MTYLIDSDRTIDLLSETEDAVRLWDTIERAGVAISAITFGEVLEGVFLGRDPEFAEQTFEQWVRAVQVLPIDEDVARHFARMRGDLRQRGMLIADTDLLIAAQMAGPNGRVIGVDMTASMLDRARASADEMRFSNVDLHEALIEAVPIEDASVDVVISNGVIDLVPDKDAVFDEIDRVLRPGGRLQLADVVIHHEVSEDARKRIDLWTG